MEGEDDVGACSPSEGQEFPHRRNNETLLSCVNERERDREGKNKILNCLC